MLVRDVVKILHYYDQDAEVYIVNIFGEESKVVDLLTEQVKNDEGTKVVLDFGE